MRGSNRRSGIDMGGCFLPMMVSVSSAARTAAVHAHVPYGGDGQVILVVSMLSML